MQYPRGAWHISLLGAVLMPGAGISATNEDPALKVRVCVNSSTYASSFVLTRGELITSRMFSSAGVALEWRSAAAAVCRGLLQPKTVVLDFVGNTPQNDHPGAMAYAKPYEAVHIVVLYDRIANSADGPNQVSALLAHFMTHEITHLLQGISRHSQTGVMKEHWSARDFEQMAYQPLPFAAEDIDLIQRGLRRIAAVSSSAVPPAVPAEFMNVPVYTEHRW